MKIGLALLFVDELYQRPLDKRLVDKICRAFEPHAFGVIIVARREDRFAIIDGQHRVAAAHRLGMLEVECQVIEPNDVEHEALIWSTTNGGRQRPSVFDMFRAAVAARKSPQSEISEWLAAEGLHIPRNHGAKNEKTVTFLSALISTWSSSPETAKNAVRWHRSILMPGEHMYDRIFRGAAYLYRRGVDLDQWADKVIKAGGVPVILGQAARIVAATPGLSTGRSHGEAILAIINKGMRHKLEISDPRSRRTPQQEDAD